MKHLENSGNDAQRVAHAIERAQAMSPGLFARSVYIDDRKANLAAAVSLGAVGLHFTGVPALLNDLHALGVDAPPLLT